MPLSRLRGSNPASSPSGKVIGHAVPPGRSAAWSPRTRALEASATGRDREARRNKALVHIWSTRHRSRAVRNGLQGSPAVGRSRRWQARSRGNRPPGRTLIRDEVTCQAVIDLVVPGRSVPSSRTAEPPAARWPRIYRATTLTAPAASLPRRTIGSALENRLLPICCPRRAIRGRSTAERAFDLGWS
jgi:hypothetical protein